MNTFATQEPIETWFYALFLEMRECVYHLLFYTGDRIAPSKAVREYLSLQVVDRYKFSTLGLFENVALEGK